MFQLRFNEKNVTNKSFLFCLSKNLNIIKTIVCKSFEHLFFIYSAKFMQISQL